MKRKPGESFEDYKVRRAASKEETKKKQRRNSKVRSSGHQTSLGHLTTKENAHFVHPE
jgi:hypothetical protein